MAVLTEAPHELVPSAPVRDAASPGDTRAREAAAAMRAAAMLRLTRAVAVAIAVLIGLASFVSSFAAQSDLAGRTPIPHRLAWLWPVMVDGTIAQATLAIMVFGAVRAAQRKDRRFFWTTLTFAVTTSIVANALHSMLPPGPVSPWLAAAIATVAPLSAVATVHGVVVLCRVTVDIDADPRTATLFKVTRIVAVAITVAIGLASFVVSFAAQSDLAGRTPIPHRLAWLWPVMVDGTIAQATLAIMVFGAVRAAQRKDRRFFWTTLTFAVTTSIVANALHSMLPPGPVSPWLAAAIATVAPLSAVATVHGVVVLCRVTVEMPAPAVSSAAEPQIPVAVQSESDTLPLVAAADESVVPLSDPVAAEQLEDGSFVDGQLPDASAANSVADQPSSPPRAEPQPEDTDDGAPDQVDLDWAEADVDIEALASTLRDRRLTKRPHDKVVAVLSYTYRHPDRLSSREIGRKTSVDHEAVGRIQRAAHTVLTSEQLAQRIA